MHCRPSDDEEPPLPRSPDLRVPVAEEGARAGALGLRESQEDGLGWYVMYTVFMYVC